MSVLHAQLRLAGQHEAGVEGECRQLLRLAGDTEDAGLGPGLQGGRVAALEPAAQPHQHGVLRGKTYAASEINKGEGGPTCLTRPLLRR